MKRMMRLTAAAMVLGLAASPAGRDELFFGQKPPGPEPEKFLPEVLTALFALMAAPVIVRAQETSDEEAVKALIQAAYVDGLQNLGDLEKTRAGFHPDFVLLGLRDGALTKLPIAEWIASAENRKAQGQKPPLITCKFLMVDVTGTAAVAKFELFREGKQIFTDYLSLYKFPDGWRIVGKIFFRHS